MQANANYSEGNRALRYTRNSRYTRSGTGVIPPPLCRRFEPGPGRFRNFGRIASAREGLWSSLVRSCIALRPPPTASSLLEGLRAQPSRSASAFGVYASVAPDVMRICHCCAQSHHLAALAERARDEVRDVSRPLSRDVRRTDSFGRIEVVCLGVLLLRVCVVLCHHRF